MSRRTTRVSELLREEISELVQRDLKDPRLEGAFLTITEVEVSPDFRVASVFVSHLGSAEERDDALAGLQSASAWLERELRRRLRMLRHPRPSPSSSTPPSSGAPASPSTIANWPATRGPTRPSRRAMSGPQGDPVFRACSSSTGARLTSHDVVAPLPPPHRPAAHRPTNRRPRSRGGTGLPSSASGGPPARRVHDRPAR